MKKFDPRDLQSVTPEMIKKNSQAGEALRSIVDGLASRTLSSTAAMERLSDLRRFFYMKAQAAPLHSDERIGWSCGVILANTIYHQLEEHGY